MSAATRGDLAKTERIVVKIGTGVVTHDGLDLALGRLSGIVEDIATLHRRGHTVLLVSSGAVGMGMRVLGHRERPTSLGIRQACAAVGQGHLVSLYNQLFGQLGVVTAQVLLTQEDLADRDRALCLRTTLMRLLELRTVPILNENDSVSVRELVEHDQGEGRPTAFGDNDGLSARVAVALDADLLVLMTDVDGLHSANPRTDPTARRIAELHGIDDETRTRATGQSRAGTGGMKSKLDAAAVATEAGTTTLIADGTMPGVLRRALAGDDVGTVVWPRSRRRARERLIAFGRARRGALVVNDGASRALTTAKASLLPIGVVSVEGSFARGDVVEIRDVHGRVLGRGVVNYDHRACAALAGHHSSEIARILGVCSYDALVTRDNLVLGEV